MEKYTVYIFKNANSCIRYIGITKQKIKNRISAHERDAFDTKRADYNCPRNCWIRKIINSIGYIPYEVIKTNLSEEVAFTLEKILIDFYGRKDLGEGPLMNADEGGTGGNRIKTPGQWNFVIASRKPVNQYDFDGNLVNSWSYILEAERETKIPNNKIISCCKGRRNSAGGFIWRYSNDNFNKFRVKNTTIRAIDVYSLHGEYLTTFKTSGEMGRIFEISKRRRYS